MNGLVQGLGFRVSGLGFRVEGLWIRVIRVQRDGKYSFRSSGFIV